MAALAPCYESVEEVENVVGHIAVDDPGLDLLVDEVLRFVDRSARPLCDDHGLERVGHLRVHFVAGKQVAHLEAEEFLLAHVQHRAPSKRRSAGVEVIVRALAWGRRSHEFPWNRPTPSSNYS